jgi:hypothetical protein
MNERITKQAIMWFASTLTGILIFVANSRSSGNVGEIGDW